MRAAGKPPETDQEFYKRRISEYGRRAFEVAASALFLYFVHWVIHTLLKALQIQDQTQPGRSVHQGLDWMVGIGYIIYVARLLLPDASEQVAEIREKIRHHWHKTTRSKKQP